LIKRKGSQATNRAASELEITSGETAQTPEYASSSGFAAVTHCSGHDPICHPRKGKGLQIRRAGTGKGGEEETLAAEKGCLQAAHKLNIVINILLECNEATRINTECLARGELFLYKCSTRVNKGIPITTQFLQYEALAAEKSRAEPFGESHGNIIGVIVDGVPAGLNFDLKFIQNEL